MTRNTDSAAGRKVKVWRLSVAVAVALAIGAEATAQGNVQSLDRAQAEQERLKKMLEGRPKAYEDKVMDATPLPAGADVTSSEPAEEGFRSWVSETRAGYGQNDSGLQLRSAMELGQRLEYRRDTLSHGTFTAQADLRHTEGDAGFGPLGFTNRPTSGRITLRNIAFPVTTRTFADSALGDIGSEVTDALSRSYRLSLGSSIVRGGSVRVFDAASDLRVGYGLRGNMRGGPYPGFERTEGELGWAGYSRRFGDQAFAGVQVSHATEVPVFTATAPAGSATATVSSAAASIGYGKDILAPGDHRGRVTLLHSSTSAGVGSANGVFVEGSARTDALRHEFGAYRADANLHYGDYLIASDNQGAYWRMDSSSRNLNWGVGVDVEEQNPRHESTRPNRLAVGLQANAQLRIDRDRLIGGSAVLLKSRYDASSAFGAAFGDGTRSASLSAFYEMNMRDWGRSRFRVTVRRNEVLVANEVPATGEEFEWEHDWVTARYETMRPEFTTVLGFARERSEGLSDLRPVAGVNFRLWPTPDWTVGGNLRYTASNSNLSTTRGLSGAVDTEVTLSGGWIVGGSLSLNQARVEIPAGGIGTPIVSRSDDKYASVYLRWQGTSGSGFSGAGLNMAGGVGAGSVAGTVYFDANRDGEQSSGEAGVPNVEVVMDGRYRATTDRQGRFAFPLVGTGRHQLTLTLETVPLPWGASSEQAVSIDVPLRGQANPRIPVVRVGE
jgi:hypothetical protein